MLQLSFQYYVIKMFNRLFDTGLLDVLTMTIDHDHDRFHGMLKSQLLVEVVIVMVTSHSPVLIP